MLPIKNNRGFVYVLINESMPNLVKVGMTTRSVEQRMSELYQTGVPTPFDLYAEYLCPDCAAVEIAVHEALSGCRVSDAREFFICPAEKAAQAVMDAHREQVEVWLDEFMPNHGIHEEDMGIDPCIPSIMATHLDMPTVDVIDAYSFLLPVDMAGAVKRKNDHYSGVKKMDWLRPKLTNVGGGE